MLIYFDLISCFPDFVCTEGPLSSCVKYQEKPNGGALRFYQEN